MLEIFQFDFIVRAFTAGILVSIIAPIIGTFLIIRRYSLMADTLAHVSLLGVAIGIITKINPVISAVFASIIGAIGIEKLRGKRKMSGDSALAIFLSGSLAIAVVLISLHKGANVNLVSYLFGSIATVSSSDLYFITMLGIFILTLTALFFKELFLVSFDDELAQASGMPAKTINLVLVILAAITVSLSIRIIGILLIGALMVIPVLTAFQYERSFKQTILLAVIFSMISVISGLFLSFYYSLATGGIIVVIALMLFLLSILLNKNS